MNTTPAIYDCDQVWHVRANATNNANDGHSYTNAKHTLDTADTGDGAVTAAEAADTGDTIYVWGGAILEEFVSIAKCLHIVGMNRDKSYVDAPSTGNTITLANGSAGSCIENLRIRGWTDAGDVPLNIVNENCSIINCNCDSYGTTSTLGAIVVGVNADNTTISGCILTSKQAFIYVSGDNTFIEKCKGDVAPTAVFYGFVIASVAYNTILSKVQSYCYAAGAGAYNVAAATFAGTGTVVRDSTFSATFSVTPTGEAVAVVVDEDTLFVNCTFNSAAENGTPYDLKVASGKTATLVNCVYDSDKVGGEGAVINGSVNVVTIVGEDPQSLDDAMPGIPTVGSVNAYTKDAHTIVDLALPDAAPDDAGGLPISDDGGLDLDTILNAATTSLLLETTLSSDYSGGTTLFITYAMGDDNLYVDQIVVVWYNNKPNIRRIRVSSSMGNFLDIDSPLHMTHTPVTGDKVQIFVATPDLATSTKQDTMETSLDLLPTSEDFEARTIESDDYVVTSDVLTVNLASTGLDNIVATEPTGVATTFREMIVQLWMRFFNRIDKDATKIQVYEDDGETVSTIQTYTEGGTTEVVSKATSVV